MILKSKYRAVEETIFLHCAVFFTDWFRLDLVGRGLHGNVVRPFQLLTGH